MGCKIVSACLLALVGAAAWPTYAADADTPAAASSLNDRLSGDISPVHDPAIIKAGDTYHLFVTGHVGSKTGIIPWRTSTDLVNWHYRGPVFSTLPQWAAETIPGTRGLWAPDISFSNGEYRLYYSVSTFGKNRSAIGLAATPTLDTSDPRFGWTDRGVVIESGGEVDFNAIDPNVITDRDGRQWMAFGSFWGGIKMVELEPATGKRKPADSKVHSLAKRPSPGAVEAPFLIERGGYYYLFASYDFCCRGVNSTYYTVVGRSTNILGPYVDREGKSMLDGGGSVVLHADQDPAKRWRGPGHIAILREKEQDYIVYHAYDAQANGKPALRIQPLEWTADGWPVAE